MDKYIEYAIKSVYLSDPPEKFFEHIRYALDGKDSEVKESISASIRYALDVYKVSDPKILSACTRETRNELDVVKDTSVSVEVLVSILSKIFMNDYKARFMLSPLIVYASDRLQEIYDYVYKEE